MERAPRQRCVCASAPLGRCSTRARGQGARRQRRRGRRSRNQARGSAAPWRREHAAPNSGKRGGVDRNAAHTNGTGSQIALHWRAPLRRAEDGNTGAEHVNGRAAPKPRTDPSEHLNDGEGTRHKAERRGSATHGVMMMMKREARCGKPAPRTGTAACGAADAPAPPCCSCVNPNPNTHKKGPQTRVGHTLLSRSPLPQTSQTPLTL